jgi:hypothetical protein
MDSKRLERTGTVVLLVATILVAISILLDGAPAKAFNGVAGITWFSATALLVVAGWKVSRKQSLWLTLIVLTAGVAFVVKPTDMVLALLGFSPAGFLVGVLARDGRILWGTLVAGLYLPFHIGTAVLKAVGRSLTGGEASIRSEPPPTAALVPLVMLLAAMAGAAVASYLIARRGAGEASSTGRSAKDLAKLR